MSPNDLRNSNNVVLFYLLTSRAYIIMQHNLQHTKSLLLDSGNGCCDLKTWAICCINSTSSAFRRSLPYTTRLPVALPTLQYISHEPSANGLWDRPAMQLVQTLNITIWGHVGLKRSGQLGTQSGSDRLRGHKTIRGRSGSTRQQTNGGKKRDHHQEVIWLSKEKTTVGCHCKLRLYLQKIKHINQ